MEEAVWDPIWGALLEEEEEMEEEVKIEPKKEIIEKGVIDGEGMREYLTEHKWPVGLQEATLRSLYNIPKRYFIVGEHAVFQCCV